MYEKIYKSFDSYYEELTAYLQEKKSFPGLEDDRHLYYWMVRMRIDRKRGLLDENSVNQLNSLGFIWDLQDYKWEQNYDRVKRLLVRNIIPDNPTHPYLYYWMNKQLHLVKIRELPAKKLPQAEELAVLLKKAKENVATHPDEQIKGKQLRWSIRYEQLIQFRKEKPYRWPKINAEDKEEKKLAGWCVFMRNYHSKGVLPEVWQEKLLALGFNFSKKENMWRMHFEELKNYIAENNDLPHSYHKLYGWTVIHYRKFNLLDANKQTLLNGIEFKKYFEARSIRLPLTWDEWYEKLKELMQRQKRLPVLKKESPLFHWLKDQRHKLRAHKLSERAAGKLHDLGIG